MIAYIQYMLRHKTVLSYSEYKNIVAWFDVANEAVERKMYEMRERVKARFNTLSARNLPVVKKINGRFEYKPWHSSGRGTLAQLASINTDYETSHSEEFNPDVYRFHLIKLLN